MFIADVIFAKSEISPLSIFIHFFGLNSEKVKAVKKLLNGKNVVNFMKGSTIKSSVFFYYQFTKILANTHSYIKDSRNTKREIYKKVGCKERSN